MLKAMSSTSVVHRGSNPITVTTSAPDETTPTTSMQTAMEVEKPIKTPTGIQIQSNSVGVDDPTADPRAVFSPTDGQVGMAFLDLQEGGCNDEDGPNGAPHRSHSTSCTEHERPLYLHHVPHVVQIGVSRSRGEEGSVDRNPEPYGAEETESGSRRRTRAESSGGVSATGANEQVHDRDGDGVLSSSFTLFGGTISGAVPINYSAVPWDQRKPVDEDSRLEQFQCCAISPHLLRRIEYCFRVTFLVVLPAAILAYNPNTKPLWISPVMLVLFAVINGEFRVGNVFTSIYNVLQGCIFYVVAMEIVVAINPTVHYAPWIIIFAVAIFVCSFFTEGQTTKMSLFLFCGRMLTHWRQLMKVDGRYDPPLYVARFLWPVLCGTLMGSAGCLLPFPRTCAAAADEHLAAIFSAISICFHGVIDSVHVPEGNTKRQVNLARIRAMRNGVDHHMVELKEAAAGTAVEPWPAYRLVRIQKRIVLAERLLAYLDTMIAFAEDVANNPTKLEHAGVAQKWLDILVPALKASCPHIDDACQRLSTSLKPYDQNIRNRLEKVRRVVNVEYDKAKNFSYIGDWHQSADPDAHFPLAILSFFLFNYGTFYTALVTYNKDDVESGKTSPSIFWRMLTYPLRVGQDTVKLLKNLLRGERQTLLKLLEAAKLSFAMTTAVALLMYLDVQDPAGGAVVVAMVKAADPTANVMSSINYVLATVLGNVAGFLLASVSQNLTQSIVYMCLCAFVFGFLRAGDKYKSLGVLGTFFTMSTLAPGNASKDRLISIIQQNVAAVLWLGFTHLILFPLWPSRALQTELVAGVERFREAVVMLAEHITTADPKVTELNTLMTELLRTVERCRVHLRNAAEEPGIKKLPYPTPEASRLIKALDAARATVVPAIVATQFSLWFKDEALKPELEKSIAWTTIEGLQRRLPRVMRHFDALARELMVCIDTTNPTIVADVAPSVLQGHEKLSKSLQEMFNEVRQTFYRSYRNRAPSVLYQTPAAVALVHFFKHLDGHLHTLVLAAVELRRLEMLRV